MEGVSKMFRKKLMPNIGSGHMDPINCSLVPCTRRKKKCECHEVNKRVAVHNIGGGVHFRQDKRGKGMFSLFYSSPEFVALYNQ